MQDLNSIANELDTVHAAARGAFLDRDLDAYQGFFTDDLRYVQPDGKAIGRAQLMLDVGKQLAQRAVQGRRFEIDARVNYAE